MPNTTQLLALALLAATPLAAQTKWQPIGATADGNVVQLAPKSVKRSGTTVDATVRVQFVKPKKMPAGDVTSSRTKMTFDCARAMVAVKENVYYHDERTDKVFQRSVAQAPGFGPVLGGSMTKVAYDHLCKK